MSRSAQLGQLASFLTPDASGNIVHSSPPAQFDSSGKLATTGFLQRQGVQFSATTRYYASTTLLVTSAADAGAIIAFNGAASQSAQLPATDGLPAGVTLSFCRGYAGAGVTAAILSGDGTACIDLQSGSLMSTFTLLAGEDATATWTGRAWLVTGTCTFRFNQFGVSFSTSGYQKIAGGLVMQWNSGFVTSSSGFTVWTFPVAFPKAILANVGTVNTVLSGNIAVGCMNGSPTGVSVASMTAAGAYAGANICILVI